MINTQQIAWNSVLATVSDLIIRYRRESALTEVIGTLLDNQCVIERAIELCTMRCPTQKN